MDPNDASLKVSCLSGDIPLDEVHVVGVVVLMVLSRSSRLTLAGLALIGGLLGLMFGASPVAFGSS